MHKNLCDDRHKWTVDRVKWMVDRVNYLTGKIEALSRNIDKYLDVKTDAVLDIKTDMDSVKTMTHDLKSDIDWINSVLLKIDPDAFWSRSLGDHDIKVDTLLPVPVPCTTCMRFTIIGLLIHDEQSAPASLYRIFLPAHHTSLLVYGWHYIKSIP